MLTRAVLVGGLAALWVRAGEARVLRNDSAEPGQEIGFYPTFQGGQYFASILDVPEDLDQYQLCSLYVWIGPNQFNVFTVDVVELDPATNAFVDWMWRSDLDAYQLFGSRDSLNEVDLRDFRVISNVRKFQVRFTHVEGFDGPPTVAMDTDGITPEHNQMSAFLRDGSFWNGYTETIVEGGPLTVPTGDWIVRALVIGPDEDCPSSGAVLPDAGIIMAPDEGPPPADAGPKPDRDDPDAAPPPRRDAAPEADAAPETDAAPAPEPDASPEMPGAFTLLRITPDRGAHGENTEVVINGRGLPTEGDVEVFIGATRALEVVAADPRLLSAIVPADTPIGVHDVEVVREDGEVAVLPQAFTVTGEADEALALTGVVPAQIVEGNLATLTLLGSGFTSQTEFFVGPVLLQGTDLQSSHRATAVLPTTLPVGVYEVAARNGDQRESLASGLTVIAEAKGPSGDSCDCRASRTGAALPWALMAAGPLLRRRRRRS